MQGLTAFLTLMLTLPAAAVAGAPVCRPDLALIMGGDSAVGITVEIADDAGERARGLMYRKALPPGQGMLFVYEAPQPVSFWMRNTPIALDMIFVDAQGEIRHIHPMARPLDETPIAGAAIGDPAPERLMVLEIAGGEAARLGIRPGMLLAHPALPQARAKVPCG